MSRKGSTSRRGSRIESGNEFSIDPSRSRSRTRSTSEKLRSSSEKLTRHSFDEEHGNTSGGFGSTAKRIPSIGIQSSQIEEPDGEFIDPYENLNKEKNTSKRIDINNRSTSEKFRSSSEKVRSSSEKFRSGSEKLPRNSFDEEHGNTSGFGSTAKRIPSLGIHSSQIEEPDVDFIDPYENLNKGKTSTKIDTQNKKWTPAQANYPYEDGSDEKYPLLESIVTMRKIKGYVNDENLLPKTTYSFLVSSHGRWITKIVNSVVLFLQVASYGAVVIAIVDFDDSNNPLQFPANVTAAVRASQFLSIVYSIVVQDSIVAALYTFRNGYNEAEIRRAFPDCVQFSNAIKFRWYMCLSIIFCLGVLAQGLTFITIMQSEDVLSVLLNYAAVKFIATIDDRVFYLGKRGWFGSTIERNVRLVSLADNPEPNKAWHRRFFHTIAMTFIFGGLIGWWVWIVSQQTNGSYLAPTIRVEFGDLVLPALGTFSGFYDILLQQKAIFSTNHATYTERRSNNQAFFGYCPDTNVWAFAFNVTIDSFDACEWDARSSFTEKFDIITTVTTQWSANNELGRTVAMDRLDISEWSCIDGDEHCGDHGSCINKHCVCDDGFFGARCEFVAPCSTLEVDGRLGPFEGISRRISTKFSILKYGNRTATAYDRPIYTTPRDEGLSLEEGFDVIFFTGRRWALAFSDAFNDPNFTDESYWENFHAHFADYEVTFLSEPVDDINDSPDPSQLSWFVAQPKDGPGIQTPDTQQSAAKLLCTECNVVSNPCFYDGQCREDSTCDCSIGSTGGLCEVPPLGNGRCDPFFNTLEFDFDSGDCCEATCVSTDTNICGKDETGFLDLGFFYCNIDEPIPSGTIEGEPFSEAGRFLALSDTGKVLAALTNDGTIGIFDKEGANWIQRNQVKTCSIQDMAIASGTFSSNPIFQPPVIIAIACADTKRIETFFCTKEGCTRTVINTPDDVNQDIYADAIEISQDGGTIAVSSRGSVESQEDGFVDIYRATQALTGSIVWRFQERINAQKSIDLLSFASAGQSRSLLKTSTTKKLALGAGHRKLFFPQKEAEFAVLENAVIGTEYAPFSGPGYVDMREIGASVTWDVDFVSSGLYEFSTSYASVNSTSAHFFVDDQWIQQFEFLSTVEWTNWTVESGLVWLEGGSHTFQIRAIETNGPNIDWLSLRFVSATEPPTNSPTESPSSSPSSSPSNSPTETPIQIVHALTMSGNGQFLGLAVGDELDQLLVRIFVYTYNGTEWVPTSQPIEVSVCSSDFDGNLNRGMIDMSFDGSSILISTGIELKIYNYNAVLSDWRQRGDEIDINQNAGFGECFIESAAISSDGDVVAANFRLGEVDTGALEVTSNSKYLLLSGEWDGSRWKNRERETLPSSRRGPVALSEAGREVTVGLPFVSPDLSGSIQSYEYPTRPCPVRFDSIRLTFTIEPDKTQWTFYWRTNTGRTQITNGGPYYFPSFEGAAEADATKHQLATVVQNICVPEDADRACTIVFVEQTAFGGFNIVGDGEIIFSLESSTSPQIAFGGNCTAEDFDSLDAGF